MHTEEEVLEYAVQLSKKILDTNTYSNYIKYKELLEKNKELSDKIQSFKRHQIDMWNKKVNNQNIDDNDLKLLNELYSNVMVSEMGSEYIQSESSIIALMADIFKIISDNIKIDLNFMDNM